MKRYFSLILYCFATTVCSAQILNSSFEYWNDGNPNFWHSTNSPLFTFISASDTAHDNMYGMRSSVVTSGGFHTVSPVWSGNFSGSTFYFPCDCRPDALHFWYQLYPTGGEGIVATVSGKQGSLGMAGNSLTFTNATNVFTEAILPIYYTQGGNADSMTIVFSMAGSPGATDYHQGAYYIIDDLSFGSATSVQPISPAIAALEFIGTNNDGATNIVYTLSEHAHVQLNVYDVTGRLVRTVLESTHAPGRYKAVENFSALTNGVYFCRLTVDGENVSKAFVVAK